MLLRAASLKPSIAMVATTRLVASGGTRRGYLEFPQQATLPADAPSRIGYNYVLNRAANILGTLVNKQVLNKTLQLHPENAFTTFLGDVKYIDISGVTDRAPEHQDFPSKKKFNEISSVATFASPKPLPYKSQSFHFVVACLPFYSPPTACSDVSAAPLLFTPELPRVDDLVRLLSSGGYVVLGCPEAYWEREDLMNKIMEIQSGSDRGFVADFLSLQKLPIALEDAAALPADKLSAYASVQPKIEPMKKAGQEVEGFKYYIALLRKLR